MSLKIFTDSQYRMLRSAQKHNNAFHHVRPEKVFAAIKTRDSLMQRGLLKFGEVYVEITDAGRQALEKIEAQP